MELSKMTDEQLLAEMEHADATRAAAKKRGQEVAKHLHQRSMAKTVQSKLSNNWPLKEGEASFVAAMSEVERTAFISECSQKAAAGIQRAVALAATIGVKAVKK